MLLAAGCETSISRRIAFPSLVSLFVGVWISCGIKIPRVGVRTECRPWLFERDRGQCQQSFYGALSHNRDDRGCSVLSNKLEIWGATHDQESSSEPREAAERRISDARSALRPFITRLEENVADPETCPDDISYSLSVVQGQHENSGECTVVTDLRGLDVGVLCFPRPAGSLASCSVCKAPLVSSCK